MKNLVLIFSCLMAMCVMSCGDDATVNPPGKSDIAGVVVLYDNVGNQLSDYSGVTVTVGSVTATSDKNGAWLLKDVPNGLYDIEFSKSGFDVTKLYGFTIGGTGTAPEVALVEPSLRTVDIVHVSLEFDSTGTPRTPYIYTKISGKLPTGYNEGLAIYYSTDSLLVSESKHVYEATYLGDEHAKNWNFYFDAANYSPIKPAKGTKLYLQIRAMPLNKYIIDPKTGRKMYPGLGAPSQVVSFTMP